MMMTGPWDGSLDQFSRRICRRMSTLMGVMDHKRGRPKQRRAGCLLCKPHKLSSAKKAARRRGRRDAMRAAHDARADSNTLRGTQVVYRE
jgi:hypothetical protein